MRLTDAKKTTWDSVWFYSKVTTIWIIDAAMVLCTVCIASWIGMAVALSTKNNVFGIMAALWALVVGYSGKSHLSNWLFMKFVVPELSKPGK